MEKTHVPIEEVKTAEQAQPWLGEPVVCKHASDRWFGRIVGWQLNGGTIPWLIYSAELGGKRFGHPGDRSPCTVGGPSKGAAFGHWWTRYDRSGRDLSISFILASDPRCDGWKIHGRPSMQAKIAMARPALPAPAMCGPGTVTRPRVVNGRVLDMNWKDWCPICHRWARPFFFFVSNRGERWSGCKTCLLTILRDAGQLKNPVSDESWRHRKRQELVEELRAGTHDDAPIKTRPRGADWEPKERDPVDEAIEAFRPVKDGDA